MYFIVKHIHFVAYMEGNWEILESLSYGDRRSVSLHRFLDQVSQHSRGIIGIPIALSWVFAVACQIHDVFQFLKGRNMEFVQQLRLVVIIYESTMDTYSRRYQPRPWLHIE